MSPLAWWKIGKLNEAVRAAPLANDLPAYLWPEVYMAMCHTQNLVPSSALQRERRKVIKKPEEYEQEEMNVEADSDDSARHDDAAGCKGTSDQGEPGGLQKKKKAAPCEIPIQDMIPYLVFHRGVSNEEFQQLAEQLKPWGVPCFVYDRREHTRLLEEREVQEFYMGPRSGSSMERAFLREPASGAVKQYMHVLVPSTLMQKHCLRMYMSEVMKRPECGPIYVSVSMSSQGRVSLCMNVMCMSNLHVQTSP